MKGRFLAIGWAFDGVRMESNPKRCIAAFLFASITLLLLSGAASAAFTCDSGPIPGSGSCVGADPENPYFQCSSIEIAECCDKVPQCKYSGYVCNDQSGKPTDIPCSDLNDFTAACQDTGGECDWLACAAYNQQCGISSSPQGRICCIGGTCQQGEDAVYRCSYPCVALGGLCGSSSVPSGLECCAGEDACRKIPPATESTCTCSQAGQPCGAGSPGCCEVQGLSCVSNTCCYSSGGTSSGGTCTSDSECCAGSACKNSKCVVCSPGNLCSSDDDCCGGLECTKKKSGSGILPHCCIPDNSPNECMFGSQCCSGICTDKACVPATCEVVPTIRSNMDVTLDPDNEEISVFLFELDEEDYVKVPIQNALIFMVNLTDKENIRI